MTRWCRLGVLALATALAACGTRPGSGNRSADTSDLPDAAETEAGPLDVGPSDVETEEVEDSVTPDVTDSDAPDATEAEPLDTAEVTPDVDDADVDEVPRPATMDVHLTCEALLTIFDLAVQHSREFPSNERDYLGAGFGSSYYSYFGTSAPITERSGALFDCLARTRGLECLYLYVNDPFNARFEDCIQWPGCLDEYRDCLDEEPPPPGSCEYVVAPTGPRQPARFPCSDNQGSPTSCTRDMVCIGEGCHSRCIPGACESNCRSSEICLPTYDGYGVCADARVTCEDFTPTEPPGGPCATDYDCPPSLTCRFATPMAPSTTCEGGCIFAAEPCGVCDGF